LVLGVTADERAKEKTPLTKGKSWKTAEFQRLKGGDNPKRLKGRKRHFRQIKNPKD
jgi:hypothetical protein